MTNFENARLQDDTQPSRPVNFPPAAPPELAAPPKILFYGIIGLFILGIAGVIGGIVIFRDVLEPARQQRVMGVLPFMEAFLPPRPGPDDTLPTAAATVSQDALNSILNLSLPSRDTPTATSAAEVAATFTPTSAPTQTPLPTLTLLPTATATLLPPTATSTPVPTAISQQAAPVTTYNITWPPSARNYGFTWERQTWNNCGPTNITMALSYFGWQRDQTYAASYLKPQREDKNVSPYELVSFVDQYSDINALYRYGGDLDLLRTLIANQFPVIVERGFTPEGYDWTGHYQTLVGYDDSLRGFYAYDSFLGDGAGGEGYLESYDNLDSGWREFNRVFIVVYTPDREQVLMQLLGARATAASAANHAFTVAQAEARANPEDEFAWFNMGTSLVALGQYPEAAIAYDRATLLGAHWRMLWYQFGLYEAYYEVGRYQDVLDYVAVNLSNGGEYVEETYYWQGRALVALGQTAQATDAFNRALNHNRNFTRARQALDQLRS